MGDDDVTKKFKLPAAGPVELPRCSLRRDPVPPEQTRWKRMYKSAVCDSCVSNLATWGCD